MEKTWTEEVLFESWSAGWDRNMPVTLCLWEDGRADLHRQTGDGYYEAVEKGLQLAAERGWEKDPTMQEVMMPTGVYIPLRRKTETVEVAS